jgi:hypothetical protein
MTVDVGTNSARMNVIATSKNDWLRSLRTSKASALGAIRGGHLASPPSRHSEAIWPVCSPVADMWGFIDCLPRPDNAGRSFHERRFPTTLTLRAARRGEIAGA